MAEGTANKGILIAVVVVALVVWFLFNKANSTVKSVNSSVKSTYTPTTAASAVAVSVAPALGTFLSSLVGGSSSPQYIPSSSSGGGVMSPTYVGSSAFTDDTIDATSYAVDPLQDLGF